MAVTEMLFDGFPDPEVPVPVKDERTRGQKLRDRRRPVALRIRPVPPAPHHPMDTVPAGVTLRTQNGVPGDRMNPELDLRLTMSASETSDTPRYLPACIKWEAA